MNGTRMWQENLICGVRGKVIFVKLKVMLVFWHFLQFLFWRKRIELRIGIQSAREKLIRRKSHMICRQMRHDLSAS